MWCALRDFSPRVSLSLFIHKAAVCLLKAREPIPLLSSFVSSINFPSGSPCVQNRRVESTAEDSFRDEKTEEKQAREARRAVLKAGSARMFLGVHLCLSFLASSLCLLHEPSSSSS